MELRNKIADMIGIEIPNNPSRIPPYTVLDTAKEPGYTRQLIEYASFGDTVIAYLLIPETAHHNPGVIVHHQHIVEWLDTIAK